MLHRILFVSGLYLLFNILVHFQVLKRWTLLHSTLSALSALLLIAGLLVNMDRMADRYRSGRGRHGGRRLLAGVAIAVILVCLNVLAVRYNGRYDTTPGRYFSLSTPTVNLLRTLRRPVTLHAFTSGDNVETLNMLHNFGMGSRWVRWEMLDAEKDPDSARRLGVERNAVIAVESGERVETVAIRGDGTVDEARLASAVQSVLEPVRKKACLTRGHGEKITLNDNPGVVAALTDFHYAVEDVDLGKTGVVPPDCRFLLIGGPETAFTPAEVEAVRAYVRRGGALMVLLDPPPGDPFAEILSDWRIEARTDVVIDPREGEILLSGAGAIPKGIEMSVIERFPSHPVTQGLRELLLFPIARSLSYRGGGNEVEELSAPLAVLDVPTAWGESDMDDLRSGTFEFNEGTDFRPPLVLALASRKAPLGPGGPVSRMVVVSSADFLDDRCMNPALSNAEFFTRCVHWLSGNEWLLYIRPRLQARVGFDLSPRHERLFYYLVMVLLPQLPLVAGAACLVRRWKRQ
ncbi:MAG: Gldg family protein [Acidobacteria bacterium]|nr:Gldg family protein [Acidobacteriota bacterium]